MKRIVITFLCFLFSLIIFVSIGIFSLFGNITQNTVIKTVKSPKEKHYAQVIACDQGALGGNTLVYVCESEPFIFKIKRLPKKIYQGEWGEFEDMKIYWKEDNCLVINSAEYEIEEK